MQKYRFGDFELDLDAVQLRLHGQPVKLERRCLDLLVLLVRNHGSMLAREDIIAALWPGNVIIDFDSGLNTLVRKVRNALGDPSDAPRFIETVTGRGYRFIAPIVELSQANTVRKHLADAWTASLFRSRLVAASLLVVLASSAAIFVWQASYWKPSDTRLATLPLVDAPTPPTPAAAIKLAVLPFKPLTASDRNESLELGMAETLIAGLNGSGRLQVSPLSSVRPYAGPLHDAAAAGRQLGVAAVLEGYIQRADNRLRVSARLLDTKDGRQLWAERYDEEFTGIFFVQDAIALRVRAALMPELVGELAGGLAHDTRDAEAYQLYANGRYYLRRNEAGMRRSIEYFELAIERDPAFARAYVGLAESYALLGVFGALAPHEAFPRARAAVDKALALDPDLGEAYASLGHIKVQYELDWPGAEKAYRRAIELSPSFAPAQQWYGHYLAYIGRIEEGMTQIRKAQSLEPASPSYGALIGMFLNYQRRYDEAIEQLNKTLETDADLDLAHTHLAVAYMYRGEYERAMGHLSRTSSVTPGSGGYLGQIYALSGRGADALAEIDRLMAVSRDHNVAAHDIATIYAALGDTDQAFVWLGRAIEDRSQLLGWVRWNPVFDAIREDPRYTEFMRRLNLS